MMSVDSTMGDDFGAFWQNYPRKSGIGAARTAFLNQIFFKGAKPEQMIAAAKKFRELKSDTKPEFIPYPSKWLEGQFYLDEDVNPPAAPIFEGWRKRLSDYLGEKVVQAWLEDASFDDGVLTLHNGRGWMFKRQYEAKLMMAGVREVV